MKKIMNIEELRELESRTFIIKADMEKWKIIIDRKLQYTRLHFAIIINDVAIKVLSKYLIESLKYNGTYIYVFYQNKDDCKKFLVKFEININTNTILIIRLKRDLNKSYIFNKAKNFYFDSSIYLEDFTNRAIEIKTQNKKSTNPNKTIEVNKKGLRIVNKGFK